MTGLTPVASPARGPSVYGEVFLRSRASIVRVAWTSPEARSSTGFVVGAEGEVVFAATERPKGEFTAERPDGRRQPLELLGYDEASRLAVGRLRAQTGLEGLPPLEIATVSILAPENWVVVIRAREGGAEPFAGVVEKGPKIPPGASAPPPHRARAARIAAPGDLGSPVLSTSGAVLGVVIEAGRRRCMVVPIDGFIPFLRGVVLGT